MRRVFIIAFAIIAVNAVVGVARAQVPGLPNDIIIYSIDCFQTVFESADMLCTSRYELDYTTFPAQDADELFVGRFVTGTVEVNASQPYVLNTTLSDTSSAPTQGYGMGLMSWYWSADDVETFNLAFNTQGYRVIVQGNPTLFADLPPEEIFDTVTDFTSVNVAPALAEHVKKVAALLATNWTANSITLVEVIGNKTVLSSNGEQYFLNAIPNLDRFAPSLFRQQLDVPAVSEATQDESLATQYETFWSSTDLTTSLAAGALLFNVGQTLFRTGLGVAIAIATAIAMFMVTRRPELAFVFAVGVSFTLSVTLGLMPMAMVAIIGFLAALGLAYTYAYGK